MLGDTRGHSGSEPLLNCSCVLWNKTIPKPKQVIADPIDYLAFCCLYNRRDALNDSQLDQCVEQSRDLWRCEVGNIGNLFGAYIAVGNGGYDGIVDSRAADLLQQIVLGFGIQKRILTQQRMLKVPLSGTRAIEL